MIAAEVMNIILNEDLAPQFPKHWQLIRIKNLFKEIDRRSQSGEEDLLSVSQYTGVTLRKDAFEDGKEITNAKTLKGYKIVEQGDLVVNIMLAWNGCLGISPYHGITSPAYCVYRVKDESKLNPEYFGYLFSTNLFKGEFRKRSTGIIESRLRLYTDSFFRIFSCVPPKDEQDSIVALINEESEKITHFIQSKQRFIELLKEQRQSIITQAVTKGIDDGVKMKETLLGKIPEYWKHTAIKRLVKTKITDGPHETPKMTNEGIPFVSAEAAVNGKIELSKRRCYISPKLHQEYCKKVKPMNGDIFMVKSGSTTGKVVIIDFDDEFSVWSPLALVRPIDSINNEFLFYAMSSNYFQREVQLNWSFGTQPNIGMAKMEQLNVAYPPTIEEQRLIVQHIKTETRTLDIAISKAEREIELIKEYREAMIAEAVTGKMKL